MKTETKWRRLLEEFKEKDKLRKPKIWWLEPVGHRERCLGIRPTPVELERASESYQAQFRAYQEEPQRFR